MNIKNEVIKIAKGLFEDEVSYETKLGSIEKWDSIGHINFLMAIEERFNLSFDPYEVFENDSIEKIAKLIESKI